MRDDRVLVAVPEPLARLQPQLLTEDPAFVGQATTLAVVRCLLDEAPARQVSKGEGRLARDGAWSDAA